MTITPRSHLEFGLASPIPRYWFGGDPFRTRFFDAHSLLTPGGEKFFIDCVREFKVQIADPHLCEEVSDFLKQEAQHSLQHARSNRRLQRQGIDAAAIESDYRHNVEKQRRLMPKRFAIALTAAYEHLTTMIAQAVLGGDDLLAEADPRIFALYAWHCAEELEHKAVSFDVMQRVARVGYVLRVFTMIWATVAMHGRFACTVNRLLRADRFGWRERMSQWRGGLNWLYGRKGLISAQFPYYFAYFKPYCHPSRQGPAPGYCRWLQAYQSSGDSMSAAAAVRAASLSQPAEPAA